jgi:hypothetical protein
MPDLLIRNVDDADLAELRRAARAEGMSMQSYMLRTVQRQAVYERRQATLAAIRNELRGYGGMTDEDRAAVRQAMDEAIDELGERHADRLAP